MPAANRLQEQRLEGWPGVTIGVPLGTNDVGSYTVALDRVNPVPALARAIADLAPELFRLEDLAPA